MNRLFRLSAVLSMVAAAVGGASEARGDSIATVVSNNSGGGVFLDLTAGANPLIVTGLQTQLSQSAYPYATNLQIWTRSGTYVGNTTSAGWTLTQTIYATATSATVNTSTLDLPVQIEVPAGGTVGVCIHSTTSNGLRITGTNSITPTTSFSNADITLFTNTVRSGTVAFGGTTTTPRAFSGTIFYVLGTGSGACCTPAGACTTETSAGCLGLGNLYQGAGTVCSPLPCAVGACCDTSGACTLTMRVSCVLPSQYTAGATCASPCATGACCKPDGSCVINYGSVCAGLSGFHSGDNSTCPSGAACFPDSEPNNAKTEVTAITLSPGDVIRGHCTGTATTVGSTADGTADTYRIRTPAMPLGVYQYRLTLNAPNGSISPRVVGLAQTSAAAGSWPGPVGSASATDADSQAAFTSGNDRITMWYGFGKQEELYYRVTGGVGALASYSVTLERSQIMPTDIGMLAAGTIDITTTGYVSPSITDTAIAVFDSGLNPIPGYSNQNQSVNSFPGSTATSNTSFLRRTYAPGVYYLAMAIGDVTTNQGAPCDDNLRNISLLDFPNVALSASALNMTSLNFNIRDGSDHLITATRTNRNEIVWFKFTVNPAVPTGACCAADGACTQISNSDCVAMVGALYHGNDTTCAGAPCQTGACCLPDTTCALQFAMQCETAGGMHMGEASACPSLPCHIETEPNSTKLEANVITLGDGESLRGRSAGFDTTIGATGIDSVDSWRITTLAATPGLYRHTLTLESATPGQSASIRGQSQAETLPGTWPGPVGSPQFSDVTAQSHIPVGDSRVVHWYGFGKQETVYYRVSSNVPGTTAPYVSTLTTTPIMPTNLGSFLEGNILITTAASGHFNDTTIHVLDSAFNLIEGWSNDDASTYGGAPGNSNTSSFLIRQYPAGTYYLGITIGDLCTNQGSPCDDNTRDGVMMDFGDVAVNFGASAETNVSFVMYDIANHSFTASRGGRGEIAWFTFTVTPAPSTGVCCRGTTCNATVAAQDCTAPAPIGAQFVPTGTPTCNVGGSTSAPCCYADVNKSSTVEVQDVFDFLNAWFGGSPLVKFGGDGTTGGLSVQDIFDFLNAWFVGCS